MLFLLFYLSFFSPPLPEDEQLAQPIHLAAQHEAKPCLGYFAVEHALVVLVVEHTDVARARIIEPVLQ